MILRGRDEYSSQDDESSGGEEKEESEGHIHVWGIIDD